MLSLEVIAQLADEVAVETRKAGTQPFLITSQHQIDNMQTEIEFPNIGSYRPDGWKMIDRLFCNKTGIGRSEEPALTLEQLQAKLQTNHAYAIVEAGEFQLYLGVFRPPQCSRCDGPRTGHAVIAHFDTPEVETEPVCNACASKGGGS